MGTIEVLGELIVKLINKEVTLKEFEHQSVINNTERGYDWNDPITIPLDISLLPALVGQGVYGEEDLEGEYGDLYYFTMSYRVHLYDSISLVIATTEDSYGAEYNIMLFQIPATKYRTLGWDEIEEYSRKC